KDVSSINIEKYFSKLIRSLYQLFDTTDYPLKFEVSIDIDQVIFDPDLAIPLGLIINEIAFNSFKHAFEREGTFYLKMTQNEEGYTLIAGDNGKGLSENSSRDSLGMSLIGILC